MTDGAEFRGSGYLRVDREKALEKLSAFGLERGTDFLLPLARCAAAAEARSLAVKGRASLTAAFDGVPFSRAELVDPYAALFAEGAEPRLTQLAVFLLAALRTRPREVSVTSGKPGSRFILRVKDLRSETLSDDDGKDWSTVVRIAWGGLSWARAVPAAKAAARAAWVLTPAGFTVDGKAPAGRPGPATAAERDGVRTVLLGLPDPAEETRVTFCAGGVAVETIATVLPTAQVRAWVDDPRLTLTASQAAVVEDARREEALAAVGAAAERFWRAGAGRLGADAPAQRRDWLLRTAVRIAGAGRPLPPELAAAPLLSDALGRPLSPDGLEAALRPDGRVEYSRVRADAKRLPSPVVLVRGPAELELLEALFPGALRDVTQLIESLAKLG